MRLEALVGEAQPATWIRAIKPEHLVVFLCWHCTIVPAQTKVDRQAICCFPVVLHERSEVQESVLIQVASDISGAEWTRLKRRGIVVIPQQEVSNRVAGAAFAGRCGAAATIVDDGVIVITKSTEKV